MSKKVDEKDLKKFEKSINNYIAGLFFSLVLTAIPYYIVVTNKLEGDQLTFAIIGYASIQLAVQLYFFVHIFDDGKPFWKSISFAYTAFVVLFIGIGSLWIMKNLNYLMMQMPAEETQQMLLEDQNFQNYHDDSDDHDMSHHYEN